MDPSTLLGRGSLPDGTRAALYTQQTTLARPLAFADDVMLLTHADQAVDALQFWGRLPRLTGLALTPHIETGGVGSVLAARLHTHFPGCAVFLDASRSAVCSWSLLHHLDRWHPLTAGTPCMRRMDLFEAHVHACALGPRQRRHDAMRDT